MFRCPFLLGYGSTYTGCAADEERTIYWHYHQCQNIECSEVVTTLEYVECSPPESKRGTTATGLYSEGRFSSVALWKGSVSAATVNQRPTNQVGLFLSAPCSEKYPGMHQAYCHP